MYIGDIYQANRDANRKDVKFFEKSFMAEMCLMCCCYGRVKRSVSSPSSAACGSSRDDVRRWMESVQNSAVEPSSSSDEVHFSFATASTSQTIISFP